MDSNSKISKQDYGQFFPFAEIREPQERAIDFILNCFKTNRYVILEAGTGVGKSAIGVTVSRFLQSKQSFLYKPDELENEQEQITSYFLTPQKILQKQYIEDFGCVKMGSNKKKKMKYRESKQGVDSSDEEIKCQGDIGDIEDFIGAQDLYYMNSISSSSNFRCKDDITMSCADRNRLAKIKGDSDENFRKCGRHCVYRQSKDKFKTDRDGVTNMQYFLSETTYVGELKKRRLLVIDEAHNCDSELCNFIDITITEGLTLSLGLVFPDKEYMNEDTTKPWIDKVFRPALMTEIEELTKETKEFGRGSRRFSKKLKQDLMDKLKRLESLEIMAMQINKFIQHYKKDDWILDVALKIEYIDGRNKEVIDKVTYKPVVVAGMAEDYLFKWGDKILFMSATILSKKIFCELIGLNADTTAMISIPSPFPIENMPMYYAPAGSMSYSSINETLPKAAKLIQRILKKHKTEKGIIHSHSYKTTEYIKENTGEYSGRILTHTSKNRDRILSKHKRSTKPTVLMSPSMQEGVDLKGDCSRFQVICKIPYPYLGDKWVKARMKRWNWWYNYETAKTIIQSIGRSIRNETDYATTYIIDSAWSSFFGRTKHLYPPNFEKRFEVKSKKRNSKKKSD
jgi:ATP-dependent DNA helicase DinG